MKDIQQDPNVLEQEPEFMQQEEMDDVSKLQSMIRELDLSGGVARIFRQTAGRAEFDYEGELPVDGFNLETIKRVYGGGRYIIRFAAKGGRYVRSIKFSVAPRHKGELEETQTPVPTQMNNDNGLIAFMMQQNQAAQQQQQQMMTLMMTLMSESSKSMAQVIAAAISGGNGRAAAPQEPASRTVELLMPLMIENMKPRGGTAEVIEQLKLLKELNGPDKEEKEEDMMTKILNVGAPILGALMNRGQGGQPQAPQPQPPAQPANNPALPTPQPNMDSQRKAEALLMKLRLATPMLIRSARENREIEPLLEMLDDILDDESYGMLCHLLGQPNWMELLFGNNPDVQAYRPWFDNFRDLILNPEDETDTPQATAESPAPGGPFTPAA